MHELAHDILDHEVGRFETLPGFTFSLRSYNPVQEKEAEHLGACLQLPRPALTWALRQGMNDQEIADHYGASLRMVTFRKNTTGVVKQISYSRAVYG